MSDGDGRGIAIEIKWGVNTMRGDRFEELWLPAAEAALDYGATGWALMRSAEGGLDFVQWAFFDSKLDWERYWYSDEISEARVRVSGLHLVPLLPTIYTISGSGSLVPQPAGAE